MSNVFDCTRRDVLLQLAALGVGAVGMSAARAADQLVLTTRSIPSTGQKLPVMGVGTNAFNEGNYADIKAVLKRMFELGGIVIDTAASYGESEAVIGRALQELGIRNQMFLSTKFNAAGKGWNANEVAGVESVERSLQRLRTDHLDLLEVHRLAGLDELMPVMQDYKRAGKIRYLGVTTFRDEEHAELAAAMRKYPLDFVQVNYSIESRGAEREIFPLALERKIAVMINVPLGGRRANLITEVGTRPLPAWASEFDATSWGQFFLKYVVSHPAVTCAVPGSTKLKHIEDNQAAGRGRLPDARQRKQMEEFWATVT